MIKYAIVIAYAKVQTKNKYSGEIMTEKKDTERTSESVGRNSSFTLDLENILDPDFRMKEVNELQKQLRQMAECPSMLID